MMLGYHLFLFLIATALGTSQHECAPFGVRLNYGRSVFDPTNKQRLGLRFNTRQPCPQIELLINNQAIIHCPIKAVSNKMKDYEHTHQLYTTYIHLCSLYQQIHYDTDIQYNLYDLQRTVKFFPQNKKIRIKDPHRKDQEFRFLNVADWGPITHQDKMEKFEPIADSMVEMIKAGEVDCLIFNGDIGYELNSNIHFHQKTMEMLEKVTSLVPVIFNRGNHEENKPEDTVGTMFEEYFELYDLQAHNATGITVGPVFFAIIDPANMLIPRLYPTFTEQSLYSSLEGVKPYLKQASQQGKTIIALTHYPLICGFPSVKHCIPDPKYHQILPLYVNIQQFYILLLKYGVRLVLSGHVHEYQRSFPLISGYRTKSRQEKTYAMEDIKEDFFIQVVEGCGGSNDGLLKPRSDGQDHIMPEFVASHDTGNTGFGLLTANGHELSYKHYRLPKGGVLNQSDQFTILVHRKEEISPEL